jgi:hypothetical protein
LTITHDYAAKARGLGLVRPRPEDEIDEKSYIYFQDLMDSLEDLPPTYSSKDLGKLASFI